MGQLGRAADRKVTGPEVEAPLDALAREFEHYDRVRNYDGSWTEWGNAVRAPIER